MADNPSPGSGAGNGVVVGRKTEKKRIASEMLQPSTASTVAGASSRQNQNQRYRRTTITNSINVSVPLPVPVPVVEPLEDHHHIMSSINSNNVGNAFTSATLPHHQLLNYSTTITTTTPAASSSVNLLTTPANNNLVCDFSGLPLFPPYQNKTSSKGREDKLVQEELEAGSSSSSSSSWINGILRDLINSSSSSASSVSIPQLIQNVRDIIHPCNPNLASLLEYKLRTFLNHTTTTISPSSASASAPPPLPQVVEETVDEEEERIRRSIAPESQAQRVVENKEDGVEKQRDEDGLHLLTLLLQCAEAVSADNLEEANKMLLEISELSTPFGTSAQRVAAYFSEAISARLLTSCLGLVPQNSFLIQNNYYSTRIASAFQYRCSMGLAHS
ncbi:Protein SCARECROW [Linum grandiflorum]